MDYLDRSRLLAAARYEALPASTLAAARLVLLDTLGAIVAGSALPENGRLAELAAGRSREGRATLLGHRMRADAFWAALANATAGVALEMDEGNRLGGGHPAIHVIPGALAVAEERGIDGRRLLEAIVAGYEIGSRLGGATTTRPNVHSHGTWGTISTAVAVARLGALDGPGMRQVINLAASMSPANTWTPALEGATIRNLYPGRSAFQGILAVDLAHAGFTALRDAPSDVYGTILADRFEPALAVDGLGKRAIASRRTTSSSTRAAATTTSPSTRSGPSGAHHPFSSEEVAAVQVTTIPFGAANGERRSGEHARRQVLGALCRGGHPRARPCRPRCLRRSPLLGDPRIRESARRVKITEDPEMGPRRTDYPTACVRIALRDGRELEETVTIVRGDALNPAPAEEVVAKFLALASPVVGPARARRAVDAVNDVGALDDVRDLARLCATE